MPATVEDVYSEVCFDLLEDGGLVLGLVTFQQFIDYLNLVLVDLLKETGISVQIFTQTVQAGVSQYPVPEPIMRPDEAYLAGTLLEQSDVQDLNNRFTKWRYTPGYPLRWHNDEIPPQTVELVPVPNYTGAFIRGTAFPDPPNGQFGDWSASVETAPAVFTTESAPVTAALTVVGPVLPTPVVGLGDPFPEIADDFVLAYVSFGVLERIFSSDSELKDPQRALWARAQYREGIAILKAITGELGPDD